MATKYPNGIEQTELHGTWQNYLKEAIIAETTNNKGESNKHLQSLWSGDAYNLLSVFIQSNAIYISLNWLSVGDSYHLLPATIQKRSGIKDQQKVMRHLTSFFVTTAVFENFQRR